MKKFLLKILVWLVPVIALHLFLGSFAGGNTDTFYRRFTSPKQSNLILGNSRAAQGIQPTYLKSLNGENFYNFSFTIFDSPYGETYLKAVQEKIKPDTKSGNFIITVVHGVFLITRTTCIQNLKKKGCLVNYISSISTRIMTICLQIIIKAGLIFIQREILNTKVKCI